MSWRPEQRAFDGLRHVNFLRPLRGADRIAVKRVDNRIAPGLLGGIAGRQEDHYVAVDGVVLQIAFQRGPMNLDVLHRERLGTGDHRRNFGLDLRRAG